ncbi:hypothetical protein C8R43DRAFT_968249 [Mycena crocata]|nr:hypothetical protein C8R43DRAFT_968249 [Mycena crocata]
MAKLYYVVYPNKFPDYWEFILSRTYGTCAEILLFGILLVLLAIGAYLLYHRAGAERRILAAATCIMALLAAVQLGIHLWGTVLAFHILRLAIQGEVWPTSPRAVAISILYSDLYAVEDFLLVTNNLVADSLFTYRCFVIWERNLRVVILPMIMVFATVKW